MAADIGVSERYLQYLQTGARVTALVRASSWRNHSGSVRAISPATEGQPATAGKTDPTAPTALPDRFVARTVFDNSDGSLLPGAAAMVKIHLARESYLSRMSSAGWRWVRTLVW